MKVSFSHSPHTLLYTRSNPHPTQTLLGVSSWETPLSWPKLELPACFLRKKILARSRAETIARAVALLGDACLVCSPPRTASAHHSAAHCNPTTLETEPGGPEIQDHPQLHREIGASLDYMRPCRVERRGRKEGLETELSGRVLPLGLVPNARTTRRKASFCDPQILGGCGKRIKSSRPAWHTFLLSQKSNFKKHWKDAHLSPLAQDVLDFVPCFQVRPTECSLTQQPVSSLSPRDLLPGSP